MEHTGNKHNSPKKIIPDDDGTARLPSRRQDNALKKLAFPRTGSLHRSLPGPGARPVENNVMLVKPSRNRWLEARRVDFCVTSMTKEADKAAIRTARPVKMGKQGQFCLVCLNHKGVPRLCQGNCMWKLSSPNRLCRFVLPEVTLRIESNPYAIAPRFWRWNSGDSLLNSGFTPLRQRQRGAGIE